MCGELERAEEWRSLIDLQGIQGGTTWQVEWFAAPIEGMLGGAAWTDLVLLRRSLERLRRLADDMPSLRPHLHSLQIGYHFRRGELGIACELGERFVAEHAPQTIVGWGPTYAMTALALIEDGRAERARALCEQALAFVSADDRSYTIMYGQLEVAHATALAVLGARPEADAILRSRIERLVACGDHAGLVALHQDRARIARLLKDRAGLKEALESMREEALAAGSSALILLADRTAELRAHKLYSPLPEPTHVSPRVTTASTLQDRAVTRFLRNCRPGTERGQHALQMLARYASSDEAYLFAYEHGAVTPVAALNDRHVPEHLSTRIRELLERTHSPSPASFSMLDAAETAQGHVSRFRVFFLAGGASDGCRGAAAVRECDSSTAELSPALLSDLCVALANNIPQFTHSE
jgi:tetratricopeptide (TPR) repeat protein